MSWLVSSIANSLKLEDDDEDAAAAASTTTPTTSSGEHPLAHPQSPNNPDDQTTTPRGVKEDLSEISKTLTRQFWGVASFLAPPPPPPPEAADQDRQLDDSDEDSADPVGINGIRNDLSEIGGRFRTGITKLSSSKEQATGEAVGLGIEGRGGGGNGRR